MDSLRKTLLYIIIPAILGSFTLKMLSNYLTTMNVWVPRLIGLGIAILTSLIIFVICERQR